MFLGILAVMTFAITACGSDGSEAGNVDPEVPEAGGESNLPEPPEGAVAVIDGREISEEAFEGEYEQVRAIPAVAERLEGDQGETAKRMLRTQVLSQMLVSEALFRAAEEDFDIKVTDEDVQARLEEMKDNAGGEEEFGRQLEGIGTTEQMLVEQDLPFALMIEQVQEEVAGDVVEEAPPASPPGQQQEPSEADLAFQEWALGKFAAAEVSVRSEFGTWDPQTGRVQPPAGVGGTGPGGQPPPG